MFRDENADKTNWYMLKNYNYIIYNKYYNVYYNTLNNYMAFFSAKYNKWMMWNGHSLLPYSKEIFICKGPFLMGVCSEVPGRHCLQAEEQEVSIFCDELTLDPIIRIDAVGNYFIIGVGNMNGHEFIDVMREGPNEIIDFPFRIFVN